MARKDFGGSIYLSFQHTEMAMKATWINQWLDEGKAVFGKINGHDGDPPEYEPIEEAIQPKTDTIWCQMKDGSRKEIYGYKKE